MNPSLNATTVMDGLVGYVAGLPVVYSKNLAGVTAALLPGYSAITGWVRLHHLKSGSVYGA